VFFGCNAGQIPITASLLKSENNDYATERNRTKPDALAKQVKNPQVRNTILTGYTVKTDGGAAFFEAIKPCKITGLQTGKQ